MQELSDWFSDHWFLKALHHVSFYVPYIMKAQLLINMS